MSLFTQNSTTAERATRLPDETVAPLSVPHGHGLDRPAVGADVIDSQGVFASVVAVHSLDISAPVATRGTHAYLVVLMAAGQEVRLPRNLLQRESEQVYRLPFAFSALSEVTANGAIRTAPAEPLVVPLLEESLQVTTRLVDSGRGLRMHKTVLETPHSVEQTLLQEAFSIEHVPLDRVVSQDALPSTHYEGDTLVIPVLEEVLVIQKELRIKQEIRITRVQHAVPTTQTVILRSEQVDIERFDENKDGES